MSVSRPVYHGLAVSPRDILRGHAEGKPTTTTTTTGSASVAGTLMGLWLCGVFATGLFGREETNGFNVLILLAASLLWPSLYFAISGQFLPRIPSRGVNIALWTFTVFASVSVYVSPIVWTSLAYVVMTLAALLLALQFNTVLTPEEYRKGFSLYAFLMVFLLVYFAACNYQPGVRLGNGGSVFNPNTVGLICLSVTAASLAINGWVIRLMVMVPTLVVLLLTDSRSAAVGNAIALAVIFWARRKHWGLGTGSKLSLVAGVMLGVGLAVVYWDSLVAVVEAFFAVHSRDRGIGSGATGRLQVWIQTWHLFTSHPLLGVGFRASPELVTAQSSAHDGYLATLAEIGIVGFCAVMYMVLSGMRRLLALTRHAQTVPIASIMLGVCMGYCGLAVFERYLLNVGNPTSLIFMLSILYAGRTDEPIRTD